MHSHPGRCCYYQCRTRVGKLLVLAPQVQSRPRRGRAGCAGMQAAQATGSSNVLIGKLSFSYAQRIAKIWPWCRACCWKCLRLPHSLKNRASKSRGHKIGLNSVLLHRGHLPADSKATGLGKCFTYWHPLHFHRIEYSCCNWPIWFNAFAAISRIASRLAFSVLSVESINSALIVEIHP